MAHVEEPFIRCLKCGNPRFVEEKEIVLQKEPVRFYDSDYQKVPPTVLDTRSTFKCSKCGEVLDRPAAAKAAEDEKRPAVQTRGRNLPLDSDTGSQP